MNFAEALNLICGRCKRDKGTCKTCPEGNWFTGSIGGYPFQVKVTDEDSAWGIDNGRIIKLFITEKPEGENKGDKEIVAYERGWSTYPEDNPEYEDLIDALYEYFQNHSDEEV